MNIFIKTFPKRSSYEQKLAEFQKEFLMNISEMVFILYKNKSEGCRTFNCKDYRKRQENYKKYRTLDKYNYEKFRTDLIGIRCLYFLKADWKNFAYLEEKN